MAEQSMPRFFMATPEAIVIIPGFNVRAIDDDHVMTFASAYRMGQSVPPLLVAVTPSGFELVDGEHRLRGAIAAGVKQIPVVEFTGDAEQRVAAAIRHNQGKPMTATERARAYQRMQNFGWSNVRIAEEAGVSEGTVANHLLIAASGDTVLSMIDSDKVKPTTVISLARSVGPHMVEDKLNEAASVRKAAVPAPKGKAAPARIKAKDVVAKPDDTAFRLLKELGNILIMLEPVTLTDRIEKADDDESLTLRMEAGCYKRFRKIHAETLNYLNEGMKK